MPVTLGAITAGIGAVQGVAGYFGAKKAQRQLEGLASPVYSPSKPINDYYSQALNRYQQSPYQSNLYKMQSQNIARGTAQGISGLQDRRSALAGIPGLVQQQNDSLLKAGATAEQDQSQKFAQLGSATQAKAADDQRVFNINNMMPYERKYNMLAQKAAANNQLMNAGLQNVFGGAQSSAIGSMGRFKNDNYYPDSNLPASTYKVPLAKY
jgi:hypothetical protein